MADSDPFQYCHSHTVTYDNFNTLHDEDHYNWCVVPESGTDSILFGAVGVLLACILPKKYYAILVLIAGAILQVFNLTHNLGRFGNGIDLWLSMQPAEIFFYVFLPPLLLDSAVRIDFFVFKKVVLQILVFAFLVVLANTLLLCLFLLYGLDMRESGWTWSHGFLFATMVASTDAVAVTAILKQGGGPESLSTLIEGESLFNDATSIVLFDIFLQQVKNLSHETGDGSNQKIWSVLQIVLVGISWLAIGGALVGIAFGFATQQLFKLLRYQHGRNEHIEVALTLGACYLCYYTANAVVMVSGVIAVVVYGLYGSATLNWEMSSRARESGIFQAFWDCITVAINGMVFFFAGASGVNFFARSVDDIDEGAGMKSAFISTFMWLPLIYLAVFALRFLLITLFSPLLRLFGSPISMNEITFVSFAGLRGALSLIMAQTVVTLPIPHGDSNLKQVRAQIALWTSGFVMMTLLINAPMIPKLLEWTGLSESSLIKMQIYERAKEALEDYTKKVIVLLRESTDELMRGVDWTQVKNYVGIDVNADDAPKANTKLQMRKSETLSLTTWSLLRKKSGEEGAPGLLGQECFTNLDDQIHNEDEKLIVFGSKMDEHAASLPINPRSKDRSIRKRPMDLEACPHWLRMTHGSVVVVSGIGEDKGDSGAGLSENSNKSGHHGAEGGKKQQHSWPEIHVSRLDKSASLPVKLEIFDSVQDLGESSLPRSNTGLLGMQNWNRAQYQKLDAVEEHEASVEVPLLAKGYSSTTRTTLQKETLHFSQASELWASKGMPNALSMHSYDTQLLIEARVRLIAGLKSLFFEKKSAGLLSNQGLRVLNLVCNREVDKANTPIALYDGICSEVLNKRRVKIISKVNFHLTKWIMNIRKRNQLIRILFSPLRWISYVLVSYLSRSMLVALEVCIEYSMALKICKMHIPWLVHSDLTMMFADEIKKEAFAVSGYIIDQEIEAPERFQAIQTYRATIAALWQQLEYIEQLSKSGLLEENEHESMVEECEGKIRALERKGPYWRWPLPSEVLRAVPFLANVSTPIFMWIMSQAKLHMYGDEEHLEPNNSIHEGGSVHVVVSGVLRSHFVNSQGEKKEFFLGKGGVVGLLPALVGSSDSMGPAYAELNALGRGPTIVTLPASTLTQIRTYAANGRAEFQQLELDMFRLAAVYLVEGMQQEFMDAATMFFLDFGLPLEHSEASIDQSKGVQGFLNLRKSHLSATILDEGQPSSDIVEPATVSRNPFTSNWSEHESTKSDPGTSGFIRECQMHAARVYRQMADTLNEGNLILLPAGHSFVQSSSTILMHGSLVIDSETGSHGGMDSVEINQPDDPSLEIFSPSALVYITNQGAKNPTLRRFKTGPAGAILLCCPVPDFAVEQQNSLGHENDVVLRQDTAPAKSHMSSATIKDSIIFNRDPDAL